MKRNFKDSNKQFIIVIIFIAFISISIYFLITSDSNIKSDHKNISNEKVKTSNNVPSNSNEKKPSNYHKSNNNVKGSKPIKIVTSNKNKTSNKTSNQGPTISYFTTDVTANKIYVGEKTNVSVNIVPSTVKTKITYTSENPYVAKISSNGVITGISPGVCNIKVNVESGGTSSFQVQVLSNPNVSSSPNSNVVSNIISSINSNKVSNKPFPHPSNITSNNSGGSYVSVQGVNLNTNVIKATVGEKNQLVVSIYPSNATNKGVIWSSSNPSIASVDSNGMVTAKALGLATITATTKDGGKKASVNVGVNNRKTFTATFKLNGAGSISGSAISCTTSHGDNTCNIKTPIITRTGYTVVGWNTSSSATSAAVGANSTLTLNGNKTYYAITKKSVTASFNLNGNITKKSCNIYNTKSSCDVTVPYYDDKDGSYGGTWSTSKTGYTQAVGYNNINIKNNVTYYAVHRHPWRTSADIGGNNYKKDRNLNIQKAYNLGPTKVVYEKGIPNSAMISHYNFLVSVYRKMPCLFSPGKIWVMTETTYSKQSKAYGLTHSYGSFFNIDVKYDSSIKAVSPGATVHELGHGWDFRFGFSHSSKKSISNQSDMVSFYNSLGASGRNNLSSVEWFAATVNDYYFLVLGMDKKAGSNSGYSKYSSSNKNKMKTLMEKYIKIAKNGYK